MFAHPFLSFIFLKNPKKIGTYSTGFSGSLQNPSSHCHASSNSIGDKVKKIDHVHIHAIGKKIPSHYCQHFEGFIEGKKNVNIGVKLTKGLAISKVERGAVAERVVQYGDLITEVDDKKVESREELEKIILEKCKNDYKFKISGIRLCTKMELHDYRFPKGYEPSPNYKYHIAILYLINGCRLALAVKSYNCKVFVTRVVEHTLTAMSLLSGDAILDVDHKPVTTVSDASDIISERLKKHGYATLLIEQPNSPEANAQVRLALLTEKSIDIDLPLAPDVVDICNREIRRLKKNLNLQPKQKILKIPKAKPRSSKSPHIHVNERTEDIPIACEDNPALLIKVPLVPPKLEQSNPSNASEK
ncbi:unnamed protein product [Thelazia callipaeda]|uniref:PDZ domain-containing protein n=1 Tax=Thelazia callipaeda TaxID=103827 RepID=A0A0N5D307_THECL|nr:unnamed protein product [Thelazia callipaeda]